MPDQQVQLAGNLLLADPSLRDGVFDRSVVLLAEHNAEDGAFGIILNHPTGHHVGDLLKDPAFSALARVPVHVGGPVSPEHLTFSAFWWNPAESSLHWQLRLPADQAIQRLKQPGLILRAFIGYSGWSAGQLESELRRSAWITARPDASLLGREHDDSLWSGILRGLSPYHRILAEAPPHPDQN